MARGPRRAQLRSSESEVRRLLADARHTEPMPVDVAARLDEVLGDLAAQRRDGGTAQSEAPVVDLASRRRRRAGGLLVAAAVVAAGVGIGHAVTSSGSGSSSSSTAGSAVSGSAESRGALSEDRGGSPGTDLLRGPRSSGLRGPALLALPRVRPDHFTDDVALARDATAPLDVTGQEAVPGTSDSTRANQSPGHRPGRGPSNPRCERADWGRGRLVVVRYDHAPAVLVLRPSRGDTQVADLYPCGSTELLRSTTLPLR